jgi:hypothetical protein
MNQKLNALRNEPAVFSDHSFAAISSILLTKDQQDWLTEQVANFRRDFPNVSMDRGTIIRAMIHTEMLEQSAKNYVALEAKHCIPENVE